MIMNRNQRPLLHVNPLQHLQHRKGHLWPRRLQRARGLQGKQLIVR